MLQQKYEKKTCRLKKQPCPRCGKLFLSVLGGDCYACTQEKIKLKKQKNGN